VCVYTHTHTHTYNSPLVIRTSCGGGGDPGLPENPNHRGETPLYR
jgi:hypothetical protein